MLEPDTVEILTTQQADRWDEVLDEIGTHSFYHRAAYHRLEELQGYGDAVMPVFREGNCIIAFPVLLRDIEIANRPTGFRDASSVRKFSGPLASRHDIPEDTRQRFLLQLQEFFKQYRVVSVYARMHPVLEHHPLLEGYGEMVNVGTSLSLDLTASPETQLSRYRRGHRRDIVALRERGFVCEEADADCLDSFLQVYYSTMDRVSASKDFYFGRSYFDHLVREMDRAHILVCKDGAQVASAAIVGVGNGIVEGMMGGTPSEYLRLAPAKLVYDFMREWSSRIRAAVLHLGGGVGGHSDSLYEFKMGFGAREHVYATWRCISDPPAYQQISQEACESAGVPRDSQWFPLYRHPGLCGRELRESVSQEQNSESCEELRDAT